METKKNTKNLREHRETRHTKQNCEERNNGVESSHHTKLHFGFVPCSCLFFIEAFLLLLVSYIYLFSFKKF